MYTNRIKHLKDDVRKLLDQVENSAHQLKLVDTLQRLGLAYHFDDEINTKLAIICDNNSVSKMEDLYSTALGFRLLRECGYKVSKGTIGIYFYLLKKTISIQTLIFNMLILIRL